MNVDLDKYIDYKVKKPHPIKKGWGFRLTLVYEGHPEITQQCSGFSTYKDAETAMKIVEAELIEHRYLVYGNTILKDFIEMWLLHDIKPRVRYSTFYSYSNVVKNHIVPILGNKRMKEINAADLNRLYNAKATYSESVTKQVNAVLRVFYDYAVDKKAARVNVARDVELPKSVNIPRYREREINADKTLTHEQIERLIEGSKGTPLYIMILLNVVMGLRCSEIIGLKYSDVDFIRRTISVERQLGHAANVDENKLSAKTKTKQEIDVKTKSSKRCIPVPDLVIEAILEEQNLYIKHRSRRKKEFQDLGYICCSTYGRPRSKNYHYEPFKKLLVELDLPNVRWHDLRATAITQLLLAGINEKAVAKFGGQANEIVTLGYYADRRKLAVTKLDKLDTYIEAIRSELTTSETEIKDFSDVIIDIKKYF